MTCRWSLRACDLQERPLSSRCCRAAHPQRSARAGHRAVHAGSGRRAWAARPFDPTQALRSRRSSSNSCATNSAISAFRRPPTMAGRSASVTGSPAPARCRQETRNYVVAITGRSVEEWSGRARQSPGARAATGPGLRHVDRARQECAQSVRARTRATRRARRREGLGRATRRRLLKDNILAAYARSMSRLGDVLAGHDPSTSPRCCAIAARARSIRCGSVPTRARRPTDSAAESARAAVPCLVASQRGQQRLVTCVS